MKRILRFGVILLVVAGIAACSTSSSGTKMHTYIVGAVGSAYNNHVPAFWKDGVLQPTLSNTGGGWAQLNYGRQVREHIHMRRKWHRAGILEERHVECLVTRNLLWRLYE